MVKARLVVVLVTCAMVLAALVPGVAAASVPSRPVNYSPYDGSDNIMLMPTLSFENYTDAHGQLAAWWQISSDNSFSNLVWETGISTGNLNGLAVPRGYLQPSTSTENTTYWWRVKVQDQLGYWSDYSVPTRFTTVVAFCPDQPENVSPANGSADISPDQKLVASGFYDADGNPHYASRWQVAGADTHAKNADGSYQQTLYDSSVTPLNKQQTALPVGLVDYGKTYYWHVKYQDDGGAWSAWSAETSFTVVKNLNPSSPRNVEPLDGEKYAETSPVLKASDFSDPDVSAYVALTDSQAGSQWQVTDKAGDYAAPVWDSDVIGAAASAAVPDGKLLAGSTYYWHVRYQDSRGNWSGWSQETSFTTKGASIPVASFVVDKTEVTAGEELVVFTDNSTVMAEIDRWVWDFGDSTGENWTRDLRPPTGEVSHKYTKAGSFTATLTVYNGAAPEGKAQSVVIVVHGKPEAGFTYTPASPKAGKVITFKDISTPTADITSWEWQFDDGATETWTAANRPEDGQITHKFKKANMHTVTLVVKSPLGESYYNKQVNVGSAGGFKFGLWMIAAGVGLVVVIAGVVYLIRARRAK